MFGEWLENVWIIQTFSKHSPDILQLSECSDHKTGFSRLSPSFLQHFSNFLKLVTLLLTTPLLCSLTTLGEMLEKCWRNLGNSKFSPTFLQHFSNLFARLTYDHRTHFSNISPTFLQHFSKISSTFLQHPQIPGNGNSSKRKLTFANKK